MASTYSPLKIELIGTGEQVGTWGSTTNTNLGTAIEQAIGGKADITMSSTSETLALANTNAAQNARALYLNLSGTPGGAATLNVPAVEKAYIVKNGTTGGFAVTVKVAGQTGVSVPTGKTMHLYNNGTDVVNAVDNLPSGATVGGVAISTTSGTVTSVSGTGTVQGLTLTGTVTSSGNLTLGGSLSAINLASQVTGTLPATNGGTAQSTYTTGDLIYASASNTLAKRAIGSTGQVLTVTGGIPTWATPTGGVTPAASSVDNGVVLFSGTGGATLKSSSAQDGFIHGLRIGRGTSGDSNNAILGRNAGNSLTTGAGTTLIGGLAGEDNTTGGSNVFIGVEAGRRVTTGGYNVAIGSAAFAYGTSIGAEENVAIGYQAMQNGTTGNDNVVIGRAVLGASFDGSFNVVVGGDSGNAMTSASNNVLLGASAGPDLTTGGGNICIGPSSGNSSSPFNLTTENQRIVMGSGNITNAYIQVAWTVVSDGRDKEDVQDAPYGLDFVSGLRPVQYKWDKRSSYYETTEDGKLIKHPKDGSKKDDKFQLGFIAQDVIALEKKFGAVDPLIGDEEQQESLKVIETKFIPILVKAIQELTARLEAAEAEIAALKG